MPESGQRVIPVVSDHEEGSATVASMVTTLGFTAIEVDKPAAGARLKSARIAQAFQSLFWTLDLAATSIRCSYLRRVGRQH